MIDTKNGLTFEVIPHNSHPETFDPLIVQMNSLNREGILPDQRIGTPGSSCPVNEILRRILGAAPTYESRHYGVICVCGAEVIHQCFLIYPFSIRASCCDTCGTVYLRKVRVLRDFFSEPDFVVIPDLPLWDHPLPYTGTIRAVPVEATKEAVPV